MKRPLIYNLEVALFCPSCKRELLLKSPFENIPDKNKTVLDGGYFGKRTMNGILDAAKNHEIEGECFESIHSPKP